MFVNLTPLLASLNMDPLLFISHLRDQIKVLNVIIASSYFLKCTISVIVYKLQVYQVKLQLVLNST